MTAKEAFKNIIDSISSIYDEGESASIAKIVMEDAFGLKHFQISSSYIFSEAEKNNLEKIISRLQTQEPVQYVLGETQFFGLKLKVNSSVLIPRQETEELVAWILETADGFFRMLDIGTGSGCIPISLKNKKNNWEVHALDISDAALEVAKENAESNQTEIIFHHGDILGENNWGHLPKYDIIVSNPPYITEKEKELMPRNVLKYEPHLALFSTNGDAQQFIKKITAFAKQKLKPGGFLFFETNEFFGKESKTIMEAAGFVNVELRKDLNGKDRMLRGQLTN